MDYLKEKYRYLLRKKYNERNRKNLNIDENNPVSIISSNCIGGVILHELGTKFNTPTINLYFEPHSYLKFIESLKYYCSLRIMEEIPFDIEHNYPRGMLDGDVIIHFLHYNTFEEACNKWMERCQRINFENLYFILAERDGLSYEQIKKFDLLELSGKKILLTCNEYKTVKNSYNFGEQCKDPLTGQLIDLCQYTGKFTGKRYIDKFNYIDFLNLSEENTK